MNGVIVPQNQCGAKSQKGFITSNFWQISVDFCRRKKARKACAVRAFRTSSDDSGNHRWRILVELAGVEPASEIPTSSVLHA